jgi:hypothetical protein
MTRNIGGGMDNDNEAEISEADADAAIGFTERRRALRAELRELLTPTPEPTEPARDAGQSPKAEDATVPKYKVTVVKQLEALAEIEVYAASEEAAETAAFDKVQADQAITWLTRDTDTLCVLGIDREETVS